MLNMDNFFVLGNHVDPFRIEPGVDYINHGTDEQMVSFSNMFIM